MMVRAAYAVLMLFGALAIVAPWLPLDANTVRLEAMLQAPSSAFWLGTDDLGRSLADRLVLGARVSMGVAFLVVAVGAVLGSAIGAVAARCGGWVDDLLTYLMDVVLAFPGMLLAIAFAAILGAGIENVVLALVLVGWVSFARLMRGQVLALQQRDHVRAAHALGVSEWSIFLRHILPLAMAPLLVEMTFGVSVVILAEAGLSFLGVGVQPPTPSWGTMIRDGSRYLLVAPHAVLVPGAALAVLVLAVNLVGDALRDRWDVRR